MNKFLKITSQYTFLVLVLLTPWIFQLSYPIIYNLISILVLIPLLKLFNSPSKLEIISNDHRIKKVYVDFNKGKYLFGIKTPTIYPKNKRRIVFYKWFLVWVPVYSKDYTFISNENIKDVLRECSYEYFESLSNRDDLVLNERLNQFKKNNNNSLWL